LYDHFKAIPDVFAHVSSLDVICEPNMIMKTKQVIKDFFAKSVEDGCEGLMIKALEAPSGLYRAGARSYAWMKLKQDYLIAETRSNGEISKLGATSYGIFLPDTLDLVPIGAFEGKGRRSGVFGSFLMASYNEESGKFETIGKVGTGFTDDKLNTLTKRLRPHVMIHDSITDIPSMFNCDSTASKRPDVWLEPKEVWEIKATQLTLSPSYTCAQEKINDIEAFTSFRAKIKPKGLAMRFPRFVRMRPDKSPFQATLSEEIAEIYKTACKYIG
jgi:DNA ligase-1